MSKESKHGFNLNPTSSHKKTINLNRLQLHALAYNLSIGSDV